MSPQKIKKPFISRLKVAPVLLAAVLLVVGGASVGVVHASIQSQIAEQQAQKAKNQSALSDLVSSATSYQDAINKLQGQIGGIENAIANNQSKQADIQNQINAAQKKLDQQKSFLRADIKSMYVNGQMSTVEMLATSQNLSSFVDAETYRGAVQSKIQDTLTQISQLQNKLNTQKSNVQSLIGIEKQQRSQLASSKAKQADLLHMNQSQQSAYNTKIKANNQKIAALEAEQVRINAASTTVVNIPGASGGSGGACDIGYGNGGYPMAWCNATQDTIPTIPYSSDPINRECTSFAYWYFTQQEGKSLHVTGNAKNWAASSSRGYSYTPHRGDIFVKTAGPFGHVGIVLATSGEDYHGYVVPSGQVLTMSMNYDYAGHFHTSTYVTGSLLYIH